MAVTDQILLAVVLVIVAVVVIAFVELKYLRKKMHNRRGQASKRLDDLPDNAYNALVTAKAILGSMARGGIHSEEATSMLREAQVAYDRRNYRVTLDLTSKAKERLLVLKAKHASQGDIAKLESLAPSAEPVATTKEFLTKEFPPNLIQSKFSMEVANAYIEEGRAAGRDVSQAVQLLDTARSRFDSKDYDGALATARLAERSARGEVIELKVAAPPTSSVATPDLSCARCGASLSADDAFCRKCGTRVTPLACASCGATLAADDTFCGKCGNPVAA